MTSSPQPEVTIGAIAKEHRAGVESFEFVRNSLGLIPRIVFAVLLLASQCLAASVTPAIRCRIGLLTCLLHGVAGVVIAAWLMRAVEDHPLGGVADYYFVLLVASVAGQFTMSAFRLYRPVKNDHRHRWSPGEPWPWLLRLYVRLFRRFAKKPEVIAFLAEPLFLLVVAGALALIEPALGRTDSDSPLPGVWAIPVLGAVGCVAMGCVAVTKKAWRAQLVRDAAADQKGAAEYFASHTIEEALRGVEGVASIGPMRTGRERLADARTSALRRVSQVRLGMADAMRRVKGGAR